MKGIILAGGTGTRLYPATISICKQLLPIYDKPMIYYPLSVLMLSGISDIHIISTPEDISRFEKMFEDGSHLGITISYQIQCEPKGLADAFIVGENFIADENVCLILGDNIFFGNGLTDILQESRKEVDEQSGAIIFGYYVSDPKRYGVIDFDRDGTVLSIEEKPDVPKSNYAQTGLYFYDNQVVSFAKKLKPSSRGELEITDLNLEYLKKKKLKAKLLGRGFSWLDTGTHDSILEAGEFISVIEKRQGYKIGCIEEVAYRMGYITKEQLNNLANSLTKSGYGDYLIKVANEDGKVVESAIGF